MNDFENMRTADIVADSRLDWKVAAISDYRGNGIKGFIKY